MKKAIAMVDISITVELEFDEDISIDAGNDLGSAKRGLQWFPSRRFPVELL